MLASVMKGSILESQLIAIIPAILLVGLVKVLVPAMLKAEKAWIRFGLGIALFGIYTVVTLVMIRHFAFGAISIEDCLTRVYVVFVLMNLIVLFTAALYFFTRDKRSMTEIDKMKLKDM